MVELERKHLHVAAVSAKKVSKSRYNKAYRVANLPALSAYQEKYRNTHRVEKNLSAKKRYEARREELQAQAATQYYNTRDQVLAQKREAYAKNRKSILEANRLKKTGWTPEAFNAAWDVQRGLCAICDRALRSGTGGAAADHCHRTFTPRGILCGPCNTALGNLRDSPKLLRAAASYLERYTAEEIP